MDNPDDRAAAELAARLSDGLDALRDEEVLARLAGWRADLGDPARAEGARRALVRVADALANPRRNTPPAPEDVVSPSGSERHTGRAGTEEPRTVLARERPIEPDRARTHPIDTRRLSRPQAAPDTVRALWLAIEGLCRELVPLPPPRRVRRFWARWREVSGDRGAPRAAVDRLLEESSDLASLASGLIAEVQNVDPASVRAIVVELIGEG